jgi:hypothetical protein
MIKTWVLVITLHHPLRVQMLKMPNEKVCLFVGRVLNCSENATSFRCDAPPYKAY